MRMLFADLRMKGGRVWLWFGNVTRYVVLLFTLILSYPPMVFLIPIVCLWQLGCGIGRLFKRWGAY